MRKIVTLIFLIIFAAQFLHGQTFYKRLQNMMKDLQYFEQTPDGGYIAFGSKSLNEFALINLDSDGNLLWNNTFEYGLYLFNHPKRKYIESLNDGNIIFTGSRDSSIIIRKFDANGESLWAKEYNSGKALISTAGTEQLSDNNLLAVFLDIENDLALIYYFSTNGELLQIKNINVTLNPNDNISFSEINQNLFVLSTDDIVIGISAAGDLLWQQALSWDSSINTLFPLSDGSFIAAGKRIYRLSTTGEILSELPSDSGTIVSGVQKNNEFYLLNKNPQELIIKSLSGNTINKISLDFNPRAIEITLDNKIVIAGKYGAYEIHIIKLNDSNKSIELVEPNGGEKLINFPGERFKWHSVNIDSVNIDISLNGGSDWKNLATNLPNRNFFYYIVPLNFSDKCLLKVSDSDDSGLYDTSDSLFSILFYQGQDYIAANNVKMWMGNNGMSAHNPITDDSGFYWPVRENTTTSSKSSIFTDGILIGGKVNSEVRVNGATYRYSWKPGSINEDGTPSDPLDPAHQLFKIKKDEPDTASDAEKLKYKLMYDNWPVEKGAPWWDVNGDGKFTRNVDTPAMIGDEVLFYVANDLDSSRTKFHYGSPPVGLEFQTIVFASDDMLVEDAVFKKVKIINKSGKAFEDVYISYWMDDDLGNANDDFVGCDTTLSLSYIYNGDNDDEGHYGTPPPALGHLLIQGPKVRSMSSDSAFFNNSWIYGYKNLEMTAYMFFDKSYLYADADLGIYEGSLQTYNQMQGLTWFGESMIDPSSNNTSTFGLSGDPVGKTGWYEGSPFRTYRKGDRRHMMSSGPFTMAPGDTQEVVYAIYMARGTDNLNSLTKLKEKAPELVDYYFNEIPKLNSQNQNLFPNEFSISNNYPNPFNASTTIEFNLPVIEGIGKASLRTVVKVYDILGREVKTLLNRELLPGPHKIGFNGNGLASGVYLLRFEAEGRFQTVKKLMLLK